MAFARVHSTVSRLQPGSAARLRSAMTTTAMTSNLHRSVFSLPLSNVRNGPKAGIRYLG